MSASPGVQCANCADGVVPAGQVLFCSKACRIAFQRRVERRGYRLLVPAMVSRATREGTRGDRDTGRWAASRANNLIQQWNDEDRAKGRLSMVDYYRRRIQLGLAE